VKGGKNTPEIFGGECRLNAGKWKKQGRASRERGERRQEKKGAATGLLKNPKGYSTVKQSGDALELSPRITLWGKKGT